MFEKQIIQLALGLLTSKKPKELEKIKTLLVKLHDYIEILYPELNDVTPVKRLAAAQKQFDKEAETSKTEVV